VSLTGSAHALHYLPRGCDVVNAWRDKGLKFEREIAVYYRANGLSGAERRVATGFRMKDRISPDLGDIRGTPGICTQAKYLAKPLVGKALADAMFETQCQGTAAGAALAILIEKRHGHADIGESWAHLPANMFVALVAGQDPYTGPLADLTFPIRTELRNIITHLAAFSAMCADLTEVAS
jgi:hypothetical protein